MKYTIIVDKQSRINPSSERKQYEIDIEELRVQGDIYDSLVIIREETYVIRRLKLSEYHVLTVLEEPVKEPLTELNIELFEGDNYIYLVDMVGNKFYAEYLIKNDFNDLYITWNEMNSAINQTAQSINLSVNQKLEGYSTTEEMNSAITVKANEITSTVQGNYATKEALNTAKSEIKQTTDSITSTVSKKVGNDEIISKINQSAEQVGINANKIQLSANDILNLLAGNTINLTSKNISISSNNFNVDKNGRIILTDTNGSNIDASLNIKSSSGNFKTYHGSNGSIYEGSDGKVSIDTGLGYASASIELMSNSNSSDYTLITNGNISALKVSQRSLESIKKNIEEQGNSLDIVKNSTIYSYNYKSEDDRDKKHIGFVIGENYNTPNEVINQEGNGIDTYSMTSLAWKAIQEQQEEIERLKQKIEKLEVQNGNN